MALDFNGTTSKLAGTITAVDTGSWTMGCWVLFDSAGESSSGNLINIQSGGVLRQDLFLDGALTTLRTRQRYGTTTANSVANQTFSTGTWYCLFSTFRSSDSKIRIYFGTTSSDVAEVAYTTQIAGVGTRSTGGTDCVIGNNTGQTVTHDGRLERVFFTNVELGLADMENYRQGDRFVAYDSTAAQRFILPLTSPNAVAEDLSGRDVAFTPTAVTAIEGPPVPWGLHRLRTIPTAGTGSTATPAALAVTTAFPASTQKADSIASPAALNATTSLPAVTPKAVSTTTPAALAVSVAFPDASASGVGGGVATPAALAVTVSIPAVTPLATSAATPAAIAASVALPAPTLLATVNLTPDPVQVAVTFPDAIISGNIIGTAHPAALVASVGFPTLTGSQPRHFTPPTQIENPPTLPSTRGIGYRLFRHYAARPAGRNVFVMNDQTVTENEPTTTYNADGTIDEEAWSRVEKLFYGGTEGEYATDSQAALLEAAGYTVDTDGLVSGG